MKWLSHIALAILLFTGLLVAIRFLQQGATGFGATNAASSSWSRTQVAQLDLLLLALTPSSTPTPSLTPTVTPSRTPPPTLTPRPTYGPETTQEAGIYVVSEMTKTPVMALTQEPFAWPECKDVTPAAYMNTVCEVKE